MGQRGGVRFDFVQTTCPFTRVPGYVAGLRSRRSDFDILPKGAMAGNPNADHHGNMVRHRLAEVGVTYPEIRPTRKAALAAILTELANGPCMVVMEYLPMGGEVATIIQGPGELPAEVTPVTGWVPYADGDGNVHYFDEATGVSSDGTQRLGHMACLECNEEIAEGRHLEGLCPTCWFNEAFEAAKARREAVTRSVRRATANACVPGLDELARLGGLRGDHMPIERDTFQLHDEDEPSLVIGQCGECHEINQHSPACSRATV